MEKFNLEKYLANPSRRVVTGDGRNVRIICTDMNCENYPIIALLKQFNDNYEDIFSYTKDGKWRVNESTRHDLFFAPEKHEGWVNVYPDDKIIGELCCRYVFHSEEEARQNRGEQAIATVKIEWGE